MEPLEDDLLSQAVAAHFTQAKDNHRGDLRDELANMRNVSRNEGFARNPAAPVHENFRTTPELEANRPSISRDYPISYHQRDFHQRPRLRFDHPRPWVGSSGNDMVRPDERRVYEADHQLRYPPDFPPSPERMPARKRRIEAFAELPPPNDNFQARHPRPRTPPNEHSFRDLMVSRPPHDFNYSRRDGHPLPPQRPFFDQPRDSDENPALWSRSSQSYDDKFSTVPPDMLYEPRNMESHSRPASLRRSKRRSTRSRVYSDESGKEESFDLMLQQHKREQNDQLHFESSRESAYLSNDDERHQVARNERYPERTRSDHQLSQGTPALGHTNVPVAPLALQKPRIPQNRESLYPLTHHNNAPSFFQHESLHSAEVPAPVQQQHPNESFQNDDESVNSGQNQEEIKVDDQEIVEDVTQPPMDNDDDDDDEELDTLRLAALLSAYNRNINKEEKFPKQEEEKVQLENEEKLTKKKSKQTKEKKKWNKKESKKSPRSAAREKSFSKTEGSPELDNNVKRIRSPEKDYSNPEILTLGNEVMKKKTMEEQLQLREIRHLNDPEEGCKRFMDIIQTKNNREQKKLKKNSSKQNENEDNYDEVEMDVEELNDPIENNESETILNRHESDIDDDLADSDPDDAEDALRPQPLPPGVEVEDEVNVGVNPRQESIWELLEQPIEKQQQPETSQKPIEPTIEPNGNINILISSIRANVEKKTAQIPVPIPVVPSTNVPSIGITSKDANNALQALETIETNMAVDSPCNYEHAFQSLDSTDSYPDIATDLALTGHEDLSSTALNDDVMDVDPLHAESATPAVQSEEEKEAEVFGKREKSVSFDDENELRAKLLNDLAIRRARDASQHEKVAETETTKPIDAVQSAEPETSAFIKSSQSNSSGTKKKPMSKKRRQFQRWKRYKMKRRLLQEQRKAETKLQTSELESPNVPTETSSSQDPKTQPLILKPAVHKSTLDSEINSSPPSPTGSPTTATITSVTTCVVATSSVIIDSFPVSTCSQASVVVSSKTAPTPPKPASSLLIQRMLHPPVVINLDNSSDEDEHVISNSQSHALADQPMRVSAAALKTKKNSASPSKTESKLTKSTSSPSLISQQVNTPVHTTTITRKRKAEDENLKSHQAKLELVKAKTEVAQRNLSDVEKKLVKVRQLLGQDKDQISHLQQKQQSNENVVQSLSVKAEELRKELKKYENLIIEAKASIEKAKSDAIRASSTMEKRRKLESRFIHQIGELQKQIVDNNFTIASLEILTSKAKVINTQKSSENSLSRSDVCEMNKNDVKAPPKSHDVIASDSTLEVPSRAISDVALATEHVSNDVIKLEKPTCATKDENVRKEKMALRKKKRQLQLQKEKYKLRETEIKLQLIKRKAKQALKAKRFGKSMMEHSIHQAYKVQRRASTGHNQSKLVKSSSRRSSSSSSFQSNDHASKSSKRRSKRRVSISLPKEHGNSDPNSAKRKSNVEMEERDEEKRDDSHCITPVTPTLRRSISDRRSSTSSVTTPTSNGNIEMNKLDGTFDAESEKLKFSFSSEETSLLRRNLIDVLKPISAPSSRFTFDQPSGYLFLADMFPIAASFANCRFDVSQLTGQNTRLSSSTDDQHRTYSQNVQKYSSPLLTFRSYRLTPLFLFQRKTNLSSNTYSHKINCNKILCRYDLAGKCYDAKCIGQHLQDITPSPNEVYLDLLWYCPALLRTNDGKQITTSDSREVQLQAAEDTVKRLCQDKCKKALTVEDTCRALVKIINRAYGNKRSFTAVMSQSRPNMSCTLKDDNDDISDDDGCPNKLQISSFSSDAPTGTEPELRYFIEEEARRNEIERLDLLLKNHPGNDGARIELAQLYLDQSKSEKEQKKEGGIEMALYTLCIGIERNDQSELLWTAYIPILRQHYVQTAVEFEQVEIVDQALMLLPLSKSVWDEVLKWDWHLDKLDRYLEQLIENLLLRQELAKSEDNPVSLDHSSTFYSSWLVQVLVERAHLLLNAKGLEEAVSMLQTIMEKLGETLEQKDRPIGQEDMCKLWLIYIHLIEHQKLPTCLYDQDMSSHMFGMNHGFGDVIVQFTSSPSRSAPEKIRQLFKDALNFCFDDGVNKSCNVKRNFAVYKSIVNFEVCMSDWDRLSAVCQNLVNLFSDEPYTDGNSPSVVDVWVMWAEAVMRSNDVVRITEIFDAAVTACPQSAKLAFIAAIYQLTSDSSDEEAALLYLEKYISSLLDLQGAEGLSAGELQQLYRRMLRLDISIKQSSRLVFKSDASEALIEKEKAYLWLIYCTLTEIVQSQNEVSSPERIQLPDLYEAALHILSSLEDRKIVWIQYLLHLRSNALTSSVDAGPSTSHKPATSKRHDQLAWLKHFTSIVRRCLATTPCKYPAKLTENDLTDDNQMKITDYTFHNEVCSIYLGCFSPNQMATALTVLTDTLPTDMPLLRRTASYYLGAGDHCSVMSLLWRITSVYSISERGACKDIQLWKIAIQALVKDKKYKKAIHLCHRALSVLPRTKDLWRDALSLILAYGDSSNLPQLNERCKAMLAVDLKSLMQSILADMQNRFH